MLRATYDQDEAAWKGAFGNGRRRSGVALVMVLGFLVLVTVLIVAYFTSVTTEASATKTYSNGASTKFLADSAVNIVMGQIAKGTQGQAAPGGNRLTWASQPGMIRTYDDTGAAASCYKLYSSPHMVIAGDSNTVMSEMTADVPTGWGGEPAIYTDLNAPVIDSGGNANFPILDGNNMKSMADPSANGSTVLTYNSSGGSTPDIEGFYVRPSYVPNYTVPTAANPLSATNTPVPMPMQWFYILRDGSVVSPDPSSSGSTATFQNASALINNGSNPIVGRVAFWTDDETCKLNINTASEGSAFAYTRVNSPTEMASPGMPQSQNAPYPNKPFGFAVSPPATGEYNRYPGHPATTCLSPALGTWLNPSGASAPSAYTTAANDALYLGLINGNPPSLSQSVTGLSAYLLASPKSSGTVAGSQAGTVLANCNITVDANYGIGAAVNPSYLTPGNDGSRLYASPDELMFRCPSYPYDSGSPAARNAFPNSSFATRSVMEEAKFFLTTSSRAPDLTPFNTPKVSMWPQWYNPADRTNPSSYGFAGAQQPEQLLAFCSSIGTSPTALSGRNEYFFEHYSPSTSAKSSVQDWNKVARNQQIGNYLYNLGNKPVPGYGNSFVAKYKQIDPLTYDSIIVESLDYIRSDLDLNEAGSPIFGGYIAPMLVTNGLPGMSGTTSFKGFGKYPICTQLALGLGVISSSGTASPFLIFDFFDPTKAYYGGYPQITGITISRVQNFGIHPLPGHAPLNVSYSNVGSSDFDNNRNFPMFAEGWHFPGDATFDNTQPTTNIGTGLGSNVLISFSDTDSPQNIFQTLTMNFPRTMAPTPNPTDPVPDTSPYCHPIAGDYALNGASDSCIVRSVECSATNVLNGDWRLLGLYVDASQINKQNIFTAHDNSKIAPNDSYYNKTLMQAHSLRMDDRHGGYWATEPDWANGKHNPPATYLGGSLVSAMMQPSGTSSYYSDFEVPNVPQGMTAALTPPYNIPGDWDTGPGIQPDGPFINPQEQIFSANWVQFSQFDFEGQGAGAVFCPNRMVASPVRFGSLPTGFSFTSPRPWQTLLFCPNPPGRTTPVGGAPTAMDHFGFTSPPDHVYLEFFTMPVVQPYAISEPLSTAGKVNLNYQLAPFASIERSTALRGVLKNTQVSGISGYNVKGDGVHPTTATSNNYKIVSGNPPGVSAETRYDINRDATIAGIEEHYFNNGMLFMYPSQICDVFLVPQYLAGATSANYTPTYPANGTPMAPPTTYDSMLAWWNPTSGAGDPLASMCMTGDNLREEPYDRLYPRLTTKSNSYTVHYRVQALQKRPSSDPATWVEGQDMVASEYRGSSLIERYIDPNDPKLTGKWDAASIAVDFSQNVGSSTDANADLSQLYKFRVISTKKFAP